MISLAVSLLAFFFNAAAALSIDIETDIEEVRLFDWDELQADVETYLNTTMQCNKSQALCFEDKETK